MHCQNEELLHDRFDELPDSIVNLIFNSVSDVKSLIRCRAVSKRFNSLVPQAESLVLKVDRVDTPVEPDSFIVSLLKSLFQSLQGLISYRPSSVRVQPSQNSPARILRVFEKIKSLEIELPCGDLELEKGSTIRWSAVYGKTLKSCVILGSRSMKYPKCDQNTAEVFDSSNGSEERRNGDGEIGVGLKTRVVWTISTLIAASARHHMLKEVIDEHKEMEMLVVKDRDGEGVVVMDKEGLRECRENDGVTNCGTCKNGADKYRTTVPDVTINMKHEPWLEIGGGARVEGAALVVVTPVGELEAALEDGGSLPIDAFDAMYGNVAKRLLRNKSFLLEMNSF